MDKQRKPKLAVWKFASCDGCQLSLLDCEDELLAIAGEIEIANFPEASRAISKGPYDVSLVEGSITTPHDIVRIQKVRKQSKFLITIGSCATAGGIQALRNYKNVQDYTAIVYAHPDYIETLAKSTQTSTSGNHQRFSERQKAERPQIQRVPGMQAKGECLRDGGEGDTLHGTDHTGGMRRSLSRISAGML